MCEVRSWFSSSTMLGGLPSLYFLFLLLCSFLWLCPIFLSLSPILGNSAGLQVYATTSAFCLVFSFIVLAWVLGIKHRQRALLRAEAFLLPWVCVWGVGVSASGVCPLLSCEFGVSGSVLCAEPSCQLLFRVLVGVLFTVIVYMKELHQFLKV